MSPDAAGLARCRQGRSALEQRISKGLPIYGVTTGVGAMKDVSLSPEDLAWFNQGLVQVHRFGTGQPLPSSVVRNAMAIRIIRLLTGRVGCTVAFIDAYLRLLSADVIPVVRSSGSIGCADIGLMGQIGAVLTGAGEAIYWGPKAARACRPAPGRAVAVHDGAARQSCVDQRECGELCRRC
jgi:histidine ammonia-lyase